MKFKIFGLFFLFTLNSFAQGDGTLNEDANKLVQLTFDTSEMKQRKYILAGTVAEEEKEVFKKEFDVAINAYIDECSKFYIANYTHDEIKQLIVFFETPAGKKLAKDHRKLLEGSFPAGKEWDMQIYQLKKEAKAKEKQE